MTRIISIAGHSGSGKTVIALNLGVALALRGRDVILVDGNIYSPDIMHYANVSPEGFLNEFLGKEKKIEEIFSLHPCGMRIIPSMPVESYDEKLHSQMNEALLHLHGKSEIVVFDTFSMHPALNALMDKSDEAFFVVNDDFASIYKSKEIMQKMKNVMGVIINRKQRKSDRKHIEAILERPVVAELPYDERIVDSINNQHPYFLSYPKSTIGKEISNLAAFMDIMR